jgi:hypothetical protein
MKERRGIVATRACPACGHHEVGILAEDGQFHPLKPGERVSVFEHPPLEVPQQIIESPLPQEESHPWAPEPLWRDPASRLKYGVLLRQQTADVDRETYQGAYLLKLQQLIAKEIFIPIAVLLDRYFTAPHLASGNSVEIALAMWEELEEIRWPAMAVGDWIENPSEEVLAKMFHPKALGKLTEPPPDVEQFRRELEALTLEEFLDLL